MRITEFFIVGAPKSGTSALGVYLNDRDDVFMVEPKEPHFFATDIPGYQEVDTMAAYQALFDRAHSKMILGDASVFHMYSSNAISLVRDFNPDARIIAMFRNPVDLAYSFHSQMLFTRDESIVSFESAWRAIDDRRNGRRIPQRCRGAKLLDYASVAKLGSQLDRLLKVFPSSQVLPIFFDDFISNTAKEYSRAVDFIGLPPTDRTDFPRVNPNRRHRSDVTAKLLFERSQVLRRPVNKLKSVLGIGEFGLIKKLRSWATKYEERQPLSEEFRRELREYFREDIQLLESLTKRDLSSWYEVAD